MQTLLSHIIPIVRKAGGMIRAARPDTLTVSHKGAADFVTDLDSSIQQLLTDGLRRLLPDAGFIGEEDGLYDTAHDDVFIIDPIDGTLNMMFGGHCSCISIGLTRRGQLVLGVVYDPYMDELYTAVKGGGAFCNGTPLHLKNNSIGDGLCSFGCSREKGTGSPAFFAIMQAVYAQSLGIRNGGSAALGLCQVAAGVSVNYLELQLMPYDCAAGVLIVQEAGGIVTRADGTPITLDGPTSILAATPRAWREIRAVYEQYKETAE